MQEAFTPDCVSLHPATYSVFPPGHVPGTRRYSAGADIPGTSHIFMSCETKLPVSLRPNQFESNVTPCENFHPVRLDF